MSVKRRLPQLYDNFDYLNKEYITEEDIGRALRRFIYCNEEGIGVPGPLLKFIGSWAAEIYKSGSFNPWNGKKAGRPPARVSNSFLFMLAWYRFHIDPKFREISKVNVYEMISESFTTSDPESLAAAALDNGGVDRIQTIDSPKSIQRAINSFQKDGLKILNGDRGTYLWNEGQLEIFCRLVLKKQLVDEIQAEMKLISDVWLENNKNN
ncbi:MAG TPA: hypothetical protein VLG12_00525 [Candidatus Saccharimonadales bacterium]|nr:hypothetical protein [Candidatus Saccharimonadales bacterium]